MYELENSVFKMYWNNDLNFIVNTHKFLNTFEWIPSY